MTRATKPNLVGAIFVTLSLLGLYCAAAYAAPEDKVQPQFTHTVKQIVIKVKSPINSLASNYAYPSSGKEVFNSYMQRSKYSFTQASRQPLLGIQVADFSNLVANKFEKKSSLFEFAAKFNDSLQQILAYFDFSSKSTINKNENISEKDLKSEISLLAKNDPLNLKLNCITD